MALGKPEKLEKIIKKFSNCRQDMEKQLEKLANLRPDMISTLERKAVDLDRNAPDSGLATGVKVAIVAATGIIAPPIGAAAAGALGGISLTKYVGREWARENAKNTLQIHLTETKVLLEILKTWESLVKELGAVYPGVDNQVLAAAAVLLSKEQSLSEHALKNIRDLMSFVVSWAGNVKTEFGAVFKIWKLNDSFLDKLMESILQALSVILSLLALSGSLVLLLVGWVWENPTVNSKTLRTLAQAMEETAAKEMELYNMLKELPTPEEVYTKKGVKYVIDKTKKIDWFLYWDKSCNQFIKILKFDGNNMFSLKTSDGQTKIGPPEAAMDEIHIQSLSISTEDEKKGAMELVEALLDLGKISPRQSDLVNLLKVVMSKNPQLNMKSVKKYIEEFQKRCDKNESFNKSMIYEEIFE